LGKSLVYRKTPLVNISPTGGEALKNPLQSQKFFLFPSLPQRYGNYGKMKYFYSWL